MSLFDVIAILLTLTALFAWINDISIRLPNTIGLLLMGLIASFVIIGLELAFPDTAIFHRISDLVRGIDFSEALLDGMLAFLLFAGALHVDFGRLRNRAWIVGTMATVGVAISTLVVGSCLWWVSNLLAMPLPLAWALVFGALISPTDPVAVLSALKAVQIDETLETDMAGESLFNDGVGVVLFTMLVAAATSGGKDIGAAGFAELFFVEAGGGGLLGLLAGYLAYRAMRLIDDYPVEVLISLALVTGTYAAASALHVSGPIAVVVAGVLVGNRGAEVAMSETTRRYLFGFWTLIDEMLNSVLFLLIGLEVLVLQFEAALVPLAAAAVPIVLFARLCAVSIPVFALGARTRFAAGTIPVLTWGGVRGGISVALVLSLGTGEFKPVLTAATYTVAVFTILVQGLSLGWLVRWLGVCRQPEAPVEPVRN
ncbi:cation:proton antiporter [Astrobacterium formosum]|uniref:cation:proton antiporter n=1 Tax=Astrobacterium formosum TaxID=3069710 RepID=UPI003F504DFF